MHSDKADTMYNIQPGALDWLATAVQAVTAARGILLRKSAPEDDVTEDASIFIGEMNLATLEILDKIKDLEDFIKREDCKLRPEYRHSTYVEREIMREKLAAFTDGAENWVPAGRDGKAVIAFKVRDLPLDMSRIKYHETARNAAEVGAGDWPVQTYDDNTGQLTPSDPMLAAIHGTTLNDMSRQGLNGRDLITGDGDGSGKQPGINHDAGTAGDTGENDGGLLQSD